jgi:hypothetical protein
MSIEDERDENHERLVEMRNQAGLTIQRHFSYHPESVIIASLKDGKVTIDITPFREVGVLCFSKQLLDKHFTETFESILMNSKVTPPEAQKND